MSEKETPDFLNIHDDYSITVTLSRAYDDNGTPRSTVKLREPTAREQRQFAPAAEKATQAQLGAIEEKMLANLSDGVTPEFLGNLALRDYARLQVAFGFFTD